MSKRMLREWFHLDRATILYGTVDGAVRAVRAIRPRRGTESSMAFLTPVGDPVTERQMRRAATEWQLQAGYQTASMFVYARIFDSPAGQALAADAPLLRVTRRPDFAEEMVELAWDLETVRAQFGEPA